MPGDIYMYRQPGVNQAAPSSNYTPSPGESGGPIPWMPGGITASPGMTDEERIQALAAMAHPLPAPYASGPPGAGGLQERTGLMYQSPESDAELMRRRDELIQAREMDPKTRELLNKRDELIQRREHDKLVALAAITKPAQGPEMLYQYLIHPMFRSQ